MINLKIAYYLNVEYTEGLRNADNYGSSAVFGKNKLDTFQRDRCPLPQKQPQSNIGKMRATLQIVASR